MQGLEGQEAGKLADVKLIMFKISKTSRLSDFRAPWTLGFLASKLSSLLASLPFSGL
jgi:hypothetical protein